MIVQYKNFKFCTNEQNIDEIKRTINSLGIIILDSYTKHVHLPREAAFVVYCMANIQPPHEPAHMIYYECLASKDSYKKFKKFAKEWNFNIVIIG